MECRANWECCKCLGAGNENYIVAKKGTQEEYSACRGTEAAVASEEERQRDRSNERRERSIEEAMRDKINSLTHPCPDGNRVPGPQRRPGLRSIVGRASAGDLDERTYGEGLKMRVTMLETLCEFLRAQDSSWRPTKSRRRPAPSGPGRTAAGLPELCR